MTTDSLDLSLTSMEWLPRITVNKQLTAIDLCNDSLADSGGGSSSSSNSPNKRVSDSLADAAAVAVDIQATKQQQLVKNATTATSNKNNINASTTRVQTNKAVLLSQQQTTAQRAEPHRPVDLTAEYRGGSDLNRREGKPPYSYVNLITFAINSTSRKRMTLNEIYEWIASNFHYYKNAGNGWKNSIRHNLSLNKCFARVQRTKDDPGKGSYWTIDNSYQEVALINPNKIRQKLDSDGGNSASSSSSPQHNSTFSPSQSPHFHQQTTNDQILLPPGSATPSSSSSSSSSSGSSSGSSSVCSTINEVARLQPVSLMPSSFVDNCPLFDDLNASFRRLYKSIIDNRDAFEHDFITATTSQLDGSSVKRNGDVIFNTNNNHHLTNNPVSSAATNHHHHVQQSTSGGQGQNMMQGGSSGSGSSSGSEPTLNTLNSDLNRSFDNFVQGIKLASNGELNLNEIDTSQFKNLIESMRSYDNNNWNMNPAQLADLASSLNNFFAQSGIMPKMMMQQHQQIMNKNNTNTQPSSSSSSPSASSTSSANLKLSDFQTVQSHQLSQHQQQSSNSNNNNNNNEQMIGDLKREDINLLKSMAANLNFGESNCGMDVDLNSLSLKLNDIEFGSGGHLLSNAFQQFTSMLDSNSKQSILHFNQSNGGVGGVNQQHSPIIELNDQSKSSATNHSANSSTQSHQSTNFDEEDPVNYYKLL